MRGRGAVRKARLERPFDDLNALFARRGHETRSGLDRPHLQPHRGQDRGRIAGTSPDHERSLARFGHHLAQQPTQDRRRGKETAIADRHRTVDIGQRPGVAGQEVLAFDAAHRVENGAVGYALRPKLAFDHRFARGGKIGNRAMHGHDCYMPITHLMFKSLISGEGSRANRHSSKDQTTNAGLDPVRAPAPKRERSPGPMAEWLRRGLQILARRFDSGSGLQISSMINCWF